MKIYQKLLYLCLLMPVVVVSMPTEPSGLGDIDEIREEVKAEPTNGETVESRRSALLRWWRLMWRRGQDMRLFDEVANQLLNTSIESEANWKAVDRGYKVLEEMLEQPVFITEKQGEKRAYTGQATDWPYYGGADGRNTGYSPDPGPSEGKMAWRFPKGFTWNPVPYPEDGKIYLSSPGIDVVGFCLEEESGEILWRARQFGEKFYGSPRTKYNPAISRDRMLIRLGNRMKLFDKQTGKAIAEGDAGKAAGFTRFSYQRGDSYVVLGNAATGKDLWHYDVESKLSGEPQLDGDTVFAAGQDGSVVKLGVDSWKPVWRVKMDDRLMGKLSIGKKAVYAGSTSSKLYAVNKADGTVLWEFDTGNPEVRSYQYFSSVWEDGNRVYFGTASSEVYCVNAITGNLIWKHKVSDWVRSRPVKKGDTLYVVTLDSKLTALKESGKKIEEKWVQSLGAHGFTADLVAGDTGLLATGRDYLLYSVDYDTGMIRWRHGILDGAFFDGQFIFADYSASLPGTPTVVDGILYIGGQDGFVNALDVETGRELWKFESGEVVTGAVSLIDGKAVFGRIASDFDNPRKEEAPPYFAVDMKTGEPIWTSREYGNVWIGALENDGIMFTGDMSGNVYGIDPDTGEKLWEYYTSKDTPQEGRPHDKHFHGWPPGVYCFPVLDDDYFYTGSWSGYYFAWEQKTGKVKWRTQTGNPDDGGGLPDSAAPTLHKNHLYVQKQGHIIAALNIQTGKIEWEWKAPVGFLQNGTLAALGDKVYASVTRRVTHIPYRTFVHCFADVENGSELLWTHQDGCGLTAPVVTDDQLMFGSSTGMYLTSLDPQTGELKWRLFTGGEMTENVPAIYGDMLFAVSKNGWLNAVK